MFDVSLSEALLIAVVALLVIGPEDLPAVMRGVGKFIRRIKRSAQDFMHIIDEESELKNIVDLEGNLREAYDISELDEISDAKKKRRRKKK